jgi:hypothetical protein
MRIFDLNTNPPLHENTEITIAGAVRVTYLQPFPHFVIEDDSGTLICRPNTSLPLPGAHIEITGIFARETPDNYTVELPLLTEINRSYVGHQTYHCDLPGCEFATLPDADKLNLMWA